MLTPISGKSPVNYSFENKSKNTFLQVYTNNSNKPIFLKLLNLAKTLHNFKLGKIKGKNADKSTMWGTVPSLSITLPLPISDCSWRGEMLGEFFCTFAQDLSLILGKLLVFTTTLNRGELIPLLPRVGSSYALQIPVSQVDNSRSILLASQQSWQN